MSMTLVWDNGASSIKVGFTSDQDARIVPNCIVKAKNERKRVYVADEVDECRDHSSLFFLLPAEKGYIVNWDVEQKVWDRVLGKGVLDVDCGQTRLIMTDPIYNVPAIRDFSDEILFEHYGFHSVVKTSATSLVALADTTSPEYRLELCCLVVDSGYSFTHVVPYCKGVAIRDGIIRIDVGGKLLSNLLKEWISYRQLNVMEETYVMNECKEDVCYVSENFMEDMRMVREKSQINLVAREYILPDFVAHHRGYIREPNSATFDDLQKLTVNIERFSVPEVLFSPLNVGIAQMGIPEAIVTSINRCPEGIRGRLFNNIVLIGGNSAFEGYRKRVESNVRSLADDLYNVRIRPVHNPITHAWQCGRHTVLPLASRFVSKLDYEENGSSICRKRYFCFI